MDNTEKNQKLGDYLRNLRESREMSVRMVEEKIAQLFPEQKQYQLSHMYLHQLEKGKTNPSPAKLKALSKVYGESYEFMLYKAGFLERNPISTPKEWNKETVRNVYFETLAQEQGIKVLGDEEKKRLEEVIKNVMAAFPKDNSIK